MLGNKILHVVLLSSIPNQTKIDYARTNNKEIHWHKVSSVNQVFDIKAALILWVLIWQKTFFLSFYEG